MDAGSIPAASTKPLYRLDHSRLLEPHESYGGFFVLHITPLAASSGLDMLGIAYLCWQLTRTTPVPILSQRILMLSCPGEQL